ncbi:hypothetical protein CEB3_c27400 [Peptococcaceae bacterium CEB3]|nr:hypothetical protein CEB3_c27400 [Peptococcaceae bacterium CEB3]
MKAGILLTAISRHPKRKAGNTVTLVTLLSADKNCSG